MSGNLATEDNLNNAVSQIASSLEEQSKEVRALTASMVAGFERIEAKFDAQNVLITQMAEMFTSNLEKSFEPFNAHMARLEKRLPLIAALTLGWALILRVLMSLLLRG